MKRRDFLKKSSMAVVAAPLLLKPSGTKAAGERDKSIVQPLLYDKIIYNCENTVNVELGDVISWNYSNLNCSSIKIKKAVNIQFTKKYQRYGVVVGEEGKYCDIQVSGYVKCNVA